MIAILLKSDALEEIAAQATKLGKAGDVAMVGAQAAANLVQNHLAQLDAERPNKLGGNRTNFYGRAAKSVQLPVQQGDGASFTITQIGLAQRWLGGQIEAGQGTSSATGGPTKYLAIPARAEAYGKTPGEFDDLEFIKTRRGGMLVETMQTPVSFGRKKKNGSRTVKHGDTQGGLVFFWLVTEVDQKPDPTIMPTEPELLAEASEAAEDYLTDLLKE